jgi:hypothetical protein
MKRKTITRAALFLSLGLLLVLSGCDFDSPNNVWDEANKNNQDFTPEIRQVLPKDAGSASTITITGRKFSRIPEENTVYFNKVLAKVVACSDTQITVYRPNIIGDTLTVKVLVKGAIAVAKYAPYRLAAVVEPFGIFLDTDAIAAIAVDAAENMYVNMDDGTMIKLKQDGTADASYTGLASNLTTDMKVGSGGALFFVRKKARVYRIPPAGGTNAIYATFADLASGDEAKAVTFDFDKNQNLFAGGPNTGLLLLRADKTQQNLGIYADYSITALRVYNDYVYVGAEYTGSQAGIPLKAVWRNKITSATGSVNASSELVLNMATAGDFSIPDLNINSITFSSDGDMYVATNHAAPVLIVKASGGTEPLYYGIVPTSVDQMAWGTGNYLYANINRKTVKSAGGKLLRIVAGKTGAPYFGRL